MAAWSSETGVRSASIRLGHWKLGTCLILKSYGATAAAAVLGWATDISPPAFKLLYSLVLYWVSSGSRWHMWWLIYTVWYSMPCFHVLSAITHLVSYISPPFLIKCPLTMDGQIWWLDLRYAHPPINLKSQGVTLNLLLNRCSIILGTYVAIEVFSFSLKIPRVQSLAVWLSSRLKDLWD